MEMPQYTGTRRLVLNTIFRQKQITRLELTGALGLSALTISKTVAALLADGIICEQELLESSGGRKPAALSINPHFAYLIGVDIGSYSCKIGVVTLDGTVLRKEDIVTYQGHMPSETLSPDALADRIQHLVDSYGADRFIAIGLSVSGIVDYAGQRTLFCPNIAPVDPHLAEILSDRFHLDVYLDTSARCMALAERMFGSGAGVDNQLFISIGFSIACGMILNGQIFRGSDGYAGEIGHIQVEEDGDLCTCGRRGCLELTATSPMIVGRIREHLSSHDVYSPLREMAPSLTDMTISHVAAAYSMGDTTVMEVVHDVCRKLGTVIAANVNMLNPHLIIFGGGLLDAFPSIMDETARYIKRSCLTPTAVNLRFARSALGADVSILGSACQMLEAYFR